MPAHAGAALLPTRTRIKRVTARATAAQAAVRPPSGRWGRPRSCPPLRAAQPRAARQPPPARTSAQRRRARSSVAAATCAAGAPAATRRLGTLAGSAHPPCQRRDGVERGRWEGAKTGAHMPAAPHTCAPSPPPPTHNLHTPTHLCCRFSISAVRKGSSTASSSSKKACSIWHWQAGALQVSSEPPSGTSRDPSL